MEPTKVSLDSLLKKRTVIPRWKSPQQAIETYSFDKDALSKRVKKATPWIRHLESTFEQFPSVSSANELYETALMYGHLDSISPNAKKLSKELQVSIKPFSSLVPYGAASNLPLIGSSDSVDVHEVAARQEIGRLRKLLGDNPVRPFCWSELSRNYLVVGEREKAIRAMSAALQLTKHNRYLCRVATRLFVHVNDIDQALHLLRNEPSIRHDPWLLAAEIATSSIDNKQSKLIDVARRLISSSQYDERQVSELAAAVGTVELMHGTIKRAKALFQMSLMAPTDNSLAQAQWAVEQDSKIVIPETAWNTPASYEAKTLASRQSHDWQSALRTCSAWLADEPFSTRPALMGSYLGFRPEHVEMAEQFATAGLRCNSENINLLNNRAVARVYQGKVGEAYADVQSALRNGAARDSAHLMATLGLIAFRSGMPELGRECYSQSIGWFTHTKERASVASALLYLLREEIRTDKAAIPQTIELAQRISKLPIAMNNPELVGMTQLVLEEAHAGLNSNTSFNDSVGNMTASTDEISHYASLFHVPDKAKQIAAQMVNYSELM